MLFGKFKELETIGIAPFLHVISDRYGKTKERG
jgi:hypothetical protein